MALTQPERLSPDGVGASESAMDDPQDSQATERYRLTSHDRTSPPVDALRNNTLIDETVMLPSFSTDLGVETLNEQVQSEIAHLRADAREGEGKGKGKARSRQVTPEPLSPPADRGSRARFTASPEIKRMKHSGCFINRQSDRSSTESASPEEGPQTKRRRPLADQTNTSGSPWSRRPLPSTVPTLRSGRPSRTPRRRVDTTADPPAPVNQLPSQPSLGSEPSSSDGSLLHDEEIEDSDFFHGQTSPPLLALDRPPIEAFEEHTLQEGGSIRNTPHLYMAVLDHLDRAGSSIVVHRPAMDLDMPHTPSSASESDGSISPILLPTDPAPSTENMVSAAEAEISNESVGDAETLAGLDSELAEVRLSPQSTALAAMESALEVCTAVSRAPRFNYESIIPEAIPQNTIKKFFATVKPKKGQPTAPEPGRSRVIALDTLLRPPGPASQSSDVDDDLQGHPTQYPRIWNPPPSAPEPIRAAIETARRGGEVPSLPVRDPTAPPVSGLHSFNIDLWITVTAFLSTQDVRNLRLVSRPVSEVLTPLLLRNVVVNFGKSFFDADGADWDAKTGRLPCNSMFKKYGDNINQFGIAFEYDLHGLTFAQPKVIEKLQTAWFGQFRWPIAQYPRFPALQTVEDLVDHNRPLLRDALEHVTNPSELGLCIDSGHGWLEGPDMSDMAVLHKRACNGSKIFGKTFTSENVWHSFALNEYFRWGQQNAINETFKYLMDRTKVLCNAELREVRFLEAMVVRDMKSFRSQSEQYDYQPDAHIGATPTGPADPTAFAEVANQLNLQGVPAGPPRRRHSSSHRSEPRPCQWPLIYNGHNISAEFGGTFSFLQRKIAAPGLSPLLPGCLTEAQAQWLMETLWAQRAFLSAYTTAIIVNRPNFKAVHTLRITKLSSGLLPSLEQREFWASLPGLKRLFLLLSPDWRQEHIQGDRNFNKNMLLSPATAFHKLTDFLRTYVVKLERLHSLTIGYVGGGEHAVGMYARNQHVLPAPIVDNPGDWLFDPKRKARALMTKFDHIRDLTFENCWFSPWMLQHFMAKSRDTSLHSLTLDSVSMLTYHDPLVEQALTTGVNHLRCRFRREQWTHEELPKGAAWCKVLDKITPGRTLLDMKYDDPTIDVSTLPPLEAKEFRGNVQKIVLKSCGYAKTTLPPAYQKFNQNSVVIHLYSPMDGGLRSRRDRFIPNNLPSLSGAGRWDSALRGADRMFANEPSNPPKNIMLSRSPNGETYPWLGTLTQCVHPIEKTILEEAFNMEFGWRDNLDRFAAVEDGYYEGGTGRFSGVIEKELDFVAME